MENNTISVYPHDPNRPNDMAVITTNDFFKNEIVVKVLPNNISPEKIKFIKRSISYVGKSYKTVVMKGGRRYRFHTELPLSPGKYEFDKEESNEDEKVIYLTGV